MGCLQLFVKDVFGFLRKRSLKVDVDQFARELVLVLNRNLAVHANFSLFEFVVE